jgi:hypothetical protein
MMERADVYPDAKKATRSRKQGAAVRAVIDEYLASAEFKELVLGEMRRLAEQKVPKQVARIATQGKSPNQLERACLLALKDAVDSAMREPSL